MSLFLNVPYQDEEKAKALGAEWDKEKKQWYVKNKNEYNKFFKWYPFYSCSEEIICDWIYIVRARWKCSSCNKNTSVISLAVENYFGINKYSGRYEYHNDDIVFITVEEEITDRHLERYLKKRFNFYHHNSPNGVDFYANHCWECGAVQNMNSLYIHGPFDLNYKSQPSSFKLFKILLNEDGVMNHYFTDSSFRCNKNSKIEILNFKIDIKDL